VGEKSCGEKKRYGKEVGNQMLNVLMGSVRSTVGRRSREGSGLSWGAGEVIEANKREKFVELETEA